MSGLIPHDASTHTTFRYADNTAQKYEHHMKYCPTSLPPDAGHFSWSLPVVRPTWYNTSDLHKAWGLLLDAAEAGECAPDSKLAASFGYDVVDVGREYLSVAPCLVAYDALAAAGKAVDATAAAAANTSMMEVRTLWLSCVCACLYVFVCVCVYACMHTCLLAVSFGLLFVRRGSGVLKRVASRTAKHACTHARTRTLFTDARLFHCGCVRACVRVLSLIHI